MLNFYIIHHSMCVWFRIIDVDHSPRPAPQLSVRITYFDAFVPFLGLAAFDGRQGSPGIEHQRPPRGLVLEGEVVVPKRHLW